MKTTFFALASLITVTFPSSAADSQRTDLATKLVTLMRVADRNCSELSDALPRLKESNPKTDAFWQEAITEHAKLYAEAFTVNELQQLITFFESPIGQSFLDRQRDILIKGRRADTTRMMQLFMDAK